MSARTRPAVSVLHSPRDEALSEKIATALSRDGHKTRCLSEDSLSGDLLLEDGAAIVIWSKATLKLARLHEQAREALERGALIPVTVGGASSPEGFEALPAVDLSGWGGDDRDPRWGFILEEINLAIQRWRTEDGAVWREAETPPLLSEDGVGAAKGDPLQDNSDQDSNGQDRSGHESTGEEGIASLGQETFSDDANADEPLNVEANYQLSVDNYWPAAPGASRRPSRFGAMSVVIVGGLGLLAASAAAIMLAPTILSGPSPLADDPDMLRDSFGTAAFVQPVSAVADETSGLKAQSDYVVTSFREDAQPPAAPDAQTQEDTPTDKLVSAQDSADSAAATDNDAEATEILVAEAISDDIEEPSSLTPTPAPPSADSTSQNAPGDYFTDCSACPKMVSLPAGSFKLGSPLSELTRQADEGPVLDITLAQPFAIAASEVTYDQWDACFADQGCREYRPSDLGWGRGNHPVTTVSYEDAQSYIAWLSAKTGKAYRLPSEAEWEFAARGGTTTAFGLGKDVSPDDANYNGNYPFLGAAGEFRGRTTPVASFAPNDFGLYDMHGNLWEWTEDCWNDSHTGAPTDGAPVILGVCGSHVLKGGAWNSGGWRLRSAHRISKRAGARENDIGFRVARDLD